MMMMMMMMMMMTMIMLVVVVVVMSEISCLYTCITSLIVFPFSYFTCQQTPSYPHVETPGRFRGPSRSLGADYWLFYSPGTPKGREQQKGNGIFVGNLEFFVGKWSYSPVNQHDIMDN